LIMKNLLMAIACLYAGFLQAQDTLYRVDGTRQIVKITEVKPAQVRYVLFSDPDGPIYVLSKHAVARIIYENGTVVSFQAIKEPNDTTALILPEKYFNRNILSFYVVDFLWGEFTLGYEHFTKSGKWGFKVPFSAAFSKRQQFYVCCGPFIFLRDNFYGENRYNVFSSGLSLNYYPFSQERITYYVGLSLLYGWFKPLYYLETSQMKGSFFAGYALNNGVFIPIAGNLEVLFQVGIGRGYVPERKYYYDDDLYYYYHDARKLRIPVEVNVCYKF